MSDEIRTRIEELKAEDVDLVEQSQIAQDQIAAIQRAQSEVNGRRIQIKGACDELERLLPPRIAEEADAAEEAN